MRSKYIYIKNSFADLLGGLDETANHVCLLTGSGSDSWSERFAWNPCGSYVYYRNNSALELNAFIKHHQAKKHLVIGMVSYDLGYSLHDVQQTKNDDLHLPDVYFLAFDNYLEKTNSKTYAHYSDEHFITEVHDLRKKHIHTPTVTLNQPFSATMSRSKYDESFKKIKNYIREGDIYQINLTHRLEAQTVSSPRDIFTRLAKNNMANMMAYIEGPDFEILSMSPERFISINGSSIATMPIKGTMPRGKNIIDDRRQKQKLLASEKERAELSMITDLLRNDLGKVSTPGSVKVTQTRNIQKLTSVMHTYSKIVGTLHHKVSPIDALISMFPGGSITGCPKKRAMEIIDELEPTTRSSYCGSIVVIDQNNNLDSNILIRTIIKKGTRLVLPVGGGIVNDSSESDEYQETLDKARSIIQSLI